MNRNPADETPIRSAIVALEDNAITFEAVAGWSWMDQTAQDAFMSRAKRSIAAAARLREAHPAAGVITPREILAEAAARYGLTPEELHMTGTHGDRRHSMARAVAALRFKAAGYSYPQIKRAIGCSLAGAMQMVARGNRMASRRAQACNRRVAGGDVLG